MAARPSLSFEFFPPAPGPAEARFWDTVERLAALEPEFVSITYGAGGTTRERSDRIVRALIDRAGRAPVRRRARVRGAGERSRPEHRCQRRPTTGTARAARLSGARRSRRSVRRVR